MSEPEVIDKDRAAPSGGLLFALLFIAFALFLLTQLTAETKFSGVEKLYEKGRLFRKGALFKEPAFWPMVGVIGMTIFGAFHAVGAWRRRAGGGELTEGAFWLRAFEYLIWFMIYVQAAPLIGYLAATMIFAALLALRAGYRGRLVLYAALTGLAIVLIFKSGLSVKIPGGAVYEYLPDGLRTFFIVHF
ncbi:MAG: tripartite tricarboxylate transporter TctB family protein [Pseudomonadota bacterium]